MHICFVSTEYPPQTAFGGVATLVAMAARGLVQRGHRVSVVSVVRDTKEQRYVENGVTVWRFSEPEQRTTLKDFWRRNRQVVQALNELKPDLVQMVEYGAEGFLLSLKNHKHYKLVTNLIDPVTLTNARREKGWKLDLEILSFMARQQVLHSDALISPSIRWANKILKESKLQTKTVRQIIEGVDLAEMKAMREAEPILQFEQPYLVYFGRLEERKGVQYLAQALPRVWQEFPNLKMVFIGLHSIYRLENVPSRQYIERLAGEHSDNLYFTNQLPREQVLPIVARAKLAVLPSIWEPYAHTCIEALALGVPVITTGDSGGNAEIVAGLDDSLAEPDSVPAGWLVYRRNPESLAAAIIEALSDEKAYAKAKANTLRRAKYFDHNKVAAQLESLYLELLGHN